MGPRRGQEIVEGRRVTRSQTKLDHLLQKDSFTTPVSSVKESGWVPASCPALPVSNDHPIFDQHVSSQPVKKLKKTGNVSHPTSGFPADEHGESDDDESSDDQLAVIDNIIQSLVAAASTPMKRPLISTLVMEAGIVGGCQETMVTKQATVEKSTSASHVEKRPEIVNPNSGTDQTVSFGLTEIAEMCNDDDSDMNSVQSAALVLIPGTPYKVKEGLAPIIQSIINSKGDIASKHLMKTSEGRSLALENLAEFIKRIQPKRFCEISQLEIQNALDLVCDFRDAHLDVGWLKQRLEDILETKKLIKHSSILKEKRDTSDRIVKEKKRKLEELKGLVNLEEKQLEIELAKAENIKSIISNAKAKVNYFLNNPLLHGLF